MTRLKGDLDKISDWLNVENEEKKEMNMFANFQFRQLLITVLLAKNKKQAGGKMVSGTCVIYFHFTYSNSLY